MAQLKRWRLLEHIGDPVGHHFDLLLEDDLHCRTWRLKNFPRLNGLPEPVVLLSPHNLSWLETKGRNVSGGRGWAKPVKEGLFSGDLPTSFEERLEVQLHIKSMIVTLEISNQFCKLSSIPSI